MALDRGIAAARTAYGVVVRFLSTVRGKRTVELTEFAGVVAITLVPVVGWIPLWIAYLVALGILGFKVLDYGAYRYDRRSQQLERIGVRLELLENSLSYDDPAFHFTYHVVKDDEFEQAFDYFGRRNGGRGRNKPLDYGIIGRAYCQRYELTFNCGSAEECQEALRRIFDFDEEAAIEYRSYGSYACFPVTNERKTKIHGVLYFAAENRGTFPEQERPDREIPLFDRNTDDPNAALVRATYETIKDDVF